MATGSGPTKTISFIVIALCVWCTFGEAFAQNVSSSQQPDPLAAAARDFKVLTRERGLRADSPAEPAQRKSRKLPWHGRVYENIRNDILDAVPHEVRQNGEEKALLRRNQFGVNVGGAVPLPGSLKDKLFLSFSYEAVRQRISRASLHTIPSVPERAGDFSAVVDQAGNVLPIYDPQTTRPNPHFNPDLPVSATNLHYLRDRFPGNRIPSQRRSAVVEQRLGLYPVPNTAIGPFLQNNYFVNAPESNSADGMISTVEYSSGARHRITVDINLSKGYLGAAKYFPNAANPGSPDQNFETRSAGLAHDLTVSSNTVNKARFNASSNVARFGTGAAGPFPVHRLGSYLPMGMVYPNSRTANHVFEASDRITSRRGKHSLQFGVHAVAYRANAFRAAYPAGMFNFSAGLTGLPGIINTGHPFASFLLGLPDYAERTITGTPSYFRRSDQRLEASDKYEVTESLTISAALNMGRHTPREERYDRQSTVDLAKPNPLTGQLGALVFAGRNGMPRGLRADSIDVNASFGIAWSPGRANTVVRASFGRSHAVVPMASGQWGTQGFNARQTFVSANSQLAPALNMTGSIPPLETPLPDLSPSAADHTVADLMDLSGRQPVYQSASLSLEREVPFSMVLSLGGQYAGGREMLVGDRAANPNAIRPDLLGYGNILYDERFRLTLQPFSQYKGFALSGLFPAGRYQRNSAFLRVEKRSSAGLTFGFYYEFSRQIDDYSAPYGVQDFFNRRNNWSPTYYNPPQYVQLNWMYELPFGLNRPFFGFSDWRRTVVEGWAVTGTAYWNYGTPLAPRPAFNNTGGVLSTLNVNVQPGVDPRLADQGPEQWFDPAAFDQPADFTLGNAPATTTRVLNPGVQTLDVSVIKRLALGTDHTIELSGSFFNFLNHANWNYPDATIGPASAPNINAGRIIGSHGGRVIQLGLKYNF